jgi:hypothetical protein
MTAIRALTAYPPITSGSLDIGDTAIWTQTFDTKDVGTGKILTPAGRSAMVTMAIIMM